MDAAAQSRETLLYMRTLLTEKKQSGIGLGSHFRITGDDGFRTCKARGNPR